MRKWKVAAAYGSGLVPVRDGIAVEDYRNALIFKVYGVPPADKWVDELVVRAAMESHEGMI